MLTRQKIRIILLGLILAFSLGVGMIIFTHQRLEEPEEIIEDISVESDAVLNHFTYTQIEEGQPKWNLKAEHGTHDAKHNITDLVNIRAEFFGDTPNGSLTMTADTAQASLDDDTIVAHGDVVLTTASGYRLRTPLLEYSQRTTRQADALGNSEADGVIQTSKEVDFETDNMRIKGVGMTYQIESRLLQIHNDVSARIFQRRGSNSQNNPTVTEQDKQ